MADDLDKSKEISTFKEALSASSSESAPDELNSTMMAIDVSKINLDATKTDIRIGLPKSPTDEDIIREQLEEKKSPFLRLVSQLWKSGKARGSQTAKLPKVLEPLQYIWVCEPQRAFGFQLLFYILRLAILVLAVLLQFQLGQVVLGGFESAHPERFFFVSLFAAELILSLFALLKRQSPGWLVTYPLAALVLIMAYGAVFYHTADRNYLSLFNAPMSDHFTEFYLFLLLYAGICAALAVFRGTAVRLMVLFLTGLGLLGVGLNLILKVRFEEAFFGPGFLSQVPLWYLKPLWLVLEVMLPLLFLIFLVGSFARGSSVEIRAARSFARSLTVLLLCVLSLNLAIMQKNRVFHVGNFLFAKRLDVGGIEFRRLGRNLKIVTQNFLLNEGQDSKARYRLKISNTKEKNRFFLQIEDVFGFPVKNLKQHDFVVTSDDKVLKDFELTEEPSLEVSKGNYWIKFNLPKKVEPVQWQMDRRNHLPHEQIEFTLDTKRVARFLVRYENEVLLEVKSPLPEKLSLPLLYFRDGFHRLEVLAYDSLEQELFHENLDVKVAAPQDFIMLMPRPQDTVGNLVTVVSRWSGNPPQGIQGIKYYFRDQLVLESDTAAPVQTLDLSGLEDGAGVIKVVLTTDQGELSKSVDVIKTDAAPSLQLTEPGMGVFADRELPVAYTLKAGGETTVAGVKVFVNGVPFHDFVLQEGRFVLPVSRWQVAEIYLVVSATVSSGQTLTDWVQVNRGVSELELEFDAATLGFLGEGKVALVMDASVSSWDSWQNRNKWQAISNLLLAPEIESRLATRAPAFYVFGAQKSYYYKDCSDAYDLLEKRSYNKSILKRLLENLEPRGVAAVVSALKQAYKTKPDTIFVFTDSSDLCEPNLVQALKNQMSVSPSTRVHVISLGKVAERDKAHLLRLVQKTGGRYLNPADETTLISMLIEELVLNYELISKDKSLVKLPLENKLFRWGPGLYTLKIPFGNRVESVPVQLEHGVHTTLKISGKKVGTDQKIHIQQSSKPLSNN